MKKYSLFRGLRYTSPRFPHRPQHLPRVEPQRLRQFQKLHHIHPSLPALQPRHERLIFAEPVSKLRLRHADGFAALDQQGD